eukprot:541391_1
MGKTEIPLHSYENYPSSTLQTVHIFDQWLPLFAFFYVLTIFSIYGYQYCSRFAKFDPNIIPIHHIGLLCLLVTLIYCALLFIESHNNQFDIPFLNSCLTMQRIHLISLVIVKYFTTWIFIFNLSYMNQSPFFNPRYKYISKKRRKFLHYLFLSFKWLIGIFLPVGIFSAFRRTDYNSFHASPNNFRYCYMIFDLNNFLFVFATDILGFILYGLLFGRNACKLTRRKIKKHIKQIDVNASSFGIREQYDIDDPIQKALVINKDMTNDKYDSESHSNSYRKHKSLSLNDDESDSDMDNILQRPHRFSASNHSGIITRSGTISRESRIISGAENNVKLQEQKGMRELIRVLRLIWFMFIFYWLNVLLYVFVGLYTSPASIALIVNSTCILLLNDYEFSKIYWSIRTDITKVFCCFCIVMCGLWCGQRKYSLQFVDDGDQYYYYDDTVYSYKSKTITQSNKKKKKKIIYYD